MSMTKIKAEALPVDLLAAIRMIWGEGAERAIYIDGKKCIMDTTLQHVEFTPEGKGFRMRVWARHMDTRVFDPAIDRAI